MPLYQKSGWNSTPIVISSRTPYVELAIPSDTTTLVIEFDGVSHEYPGNNNLTVEFSTNNGISYSNQVDVGSTMTNAVNEKRMAVVHHYNGNGYVISDNISQGLNNPVQLASSVIMNRLLLGADMANHYVWSLAHPDWEVRYDMDKAQAAQTRRRLLGMLAADRVPFIGYHMPFPGVGFVEAVGEGFRFVPHSYQMML